MRIIAKLDVKPPFVVKPVHFEGLRKIGAPVEKALEYYHQGADEIFYIDIVSSLYQRPLILEQIEPINSQIQIPFAVGGGVKSINDFSDLLLSGADKVVINSHALQNSPDIIDLAARTFGSQAVVVNIEAKKTDLGYECFSDCGRIPSGKSVKNWIAEVESRGAGEILVQSIDRDGRRKGFDMDLADLTVNSAGIPVVIASGACSTECVLTLAKEIEPSGVAIASILHYGDASIDQIKALLKNEREKGLV